jgi:phenylacetic acid degradation operon negative regulatory protein
VAFVVRTLLVHSFRRVVLHDPLFPDELLPSSWPGPAAYALCRELYWLTYEPAEAFLTATLEGTDGALPPTAPSVLRALRRRGAGPCLTGWANGCNLIHYSG